MNTWPYIVLRARVELDYISFYRCTGRPIDIFDMAGTYVQVNSTNGSRMYLALS